MKNGSLMPEKYFPRLIDTKISEYLDIFGAIEVAGPMWCGKTWTSMAFGESISRIGTTSVRTMAEADPTTVLLGKKPHVIDEWQDVPQIWDEVKATIDESGCVAGQYILTGSSAPNKEKVHHSGAGRIQKLRMSTMTLFESGKSSGKVSLSKLFDGKFETCLVQQKLAPLAEYICQGGWPSLIEKDIADSKPFLSSYLNALLSVSIPRKGLKTSEGRKLLKAIARNLGCAVNDTTLTSDVGFTDRKQTASYIDAFEELYVIDPLGGWDAPIRSKSRMRTKPKYYFADSSIPARLLNVTPERLLLDGQLFGLLFESLCIHDLSVYASLLPNIGDTPLYYYRDSDGLEVDSIIELNDGRWAAFEIKLGENKVEEAAKTLKRLKNKILLNPLAKNREPEFLAVIVGAAELARYDKTLGVYIIPITALGA